MCRHAGGCAGPPYMQANKPAAAPALRAARRRLDACGSHAHARRAVRGGDARRNALHRTVHALNFHLYARHRVAHLEVHCMLAAVRQRQQQLLAWGRQYGARGVSAALPRQAAKQEHPRVPQCARTCTPSPSSSLTSRALMSLYCSRVPDSAPSSIAPGARARRGALYERRRATERSSRARHCRRDAVAGLQSGAEPVADAGGAWVAENCVQSAARRSVRRLCGVQKKAVTVRL